LIRDDRQASHLSAAGHALVERLYTWERSAADLERVYLQVAACAPKALTYA